MGDCFSIRAPRHDPKAKKRRIPPLLAQAQSEDRQAAQPRHLRHARRRREARARGPILQAPLNMRVRLPYSHFDSTANMLVSPSYSTYRKPAVDLEAIGQQCGASAIVDDAV